MKSLFYIGHTFPEPTTTAAGLRTLQILQVFKKLGYEINFGTTAQKTEYALNFNSENINFIPLQLNDSSFDSILNTLKPNIVIYDRFITEEQFGWRVQENCPNTLQILDTQDLHFLRKAREYAHKTNTPIQLLNDTTKREIASILRCDVSLLISEYEINLLKNKFKIPSKILYYLPFVIQKITKSKIPFENRNHFVFIGNFLHAPNVDSLKWLKNNIWKQIKNQIPEAQLLVYGAYIPQQIAQMHDETTGFLIKGWAPSAKKILQQARVCLAPLRFGAGLKGKVIDAMQAGTPVVTTKVGAEGITENGFFNGVVKASTAEAIVDQAVFLYTNKTNWKAAQEESYNILEERFLEKMHIHRFKQSLQIIENNLSNYREENLFWQILNYHTLKSNKYLSKWIEEKNKQN